MQPVNLTQINLTKYLNFYLQDGKEIMDYDMDNFRQCKRSDFEKVGAGKVWDEAIESGSFHINENKVCFSESINSRLNISAGSKGAINLGFLSCGNRSQCASLED